MKKQPINRPAQTMSKGKDTAPSFTQGDDSDIPFGAGGIKVLYYKKYNKTATPTRGTLLLEKNTISFRSKRIHYRWDLDSITVVQFKGTFYPGMKILERWKTEGDYEEGHHFTKVYQRSYNDIRRAIDQAKVDSEINHSGEDIKLWRNPFHFLSVAKSAVLSGLAPRASAVPGARSVGIRRESYYQIPFHFLSAAISAVLSFVYKQAGLVPGESAVPGARSVGIRRERYFRNPFHFLSTTISAILSFFYKKVGLAPGESAVPGTRSGGISRERGHRSLRAAPEGGSNNEKSAPGESVVRRARSVGIRRESGHRSLRTAPKDRSNNEKSVPGESVVPGARTGRVCRQRGHRRLHADPGEAADTWSSASI